MYYSQLRAFHAVAFYGGFTKAAKQLNRTQPAISDQVRKLEKEFGILLFDRHRRSVQLTTVGHRLFEISQRMLDMEDEAVKLLSESQALQTGHLKMAADASLHVVQLVGEFRQQYPGISVSLTIGNSDVVLGQLLDYTADVGVLANVPADNRFHDITLRRDPLVAFVNKKHPWAGRQSVSLADFASEPLVLREEGSVTRRIVEEEFNRMGLDYNLAMVVEGREANHEAVAAGIGVGIVSLPEFGSDPRLRIISLKNCDRTMTESLVCLKERADLRTIRAFWTLAIEHIKRQTSG
ncbi:MAG: LysR family transcriptional regulator [Alphaproteobacteria bacterium]|nr:LysR family transcriptional regulator [Alphaproteobacteria bacterium]